MVVILLCNIAALLWLERTIPWKNHHHQEKLPSRIDPLAQKGLLLDLIETFRPLAHHAPVIQEGAHRFERVREYLHDNYMRALTLDELASVVSLSPYHFQRQFKAHFHVTPHQMLMAIRLWRAKAFLTHGMPAAEVAAATGLTDQSHLTRAFTHRYGITPVRYQKQVTRR